MGRIIIGNQAAMTGCTFATGAFAAQTAPANLLRLEPSDCLILEDPNDLRIDVGLVQPEPVRLIMPHNVSLAMSGEWNVEASTSKSGLDSAPVAITAGWVPYAPGEAGPLHRKGYRHDWIWSTAALTYQWWRLRFRDQANPTAPMSIGGLFVDPAWQPGINYAYNAQEPYLYDPSRAPRAEAGQLPPLYERPYDRAAVTFEALSRTDVKRDLRHLSEYCGTRKPVAVIFDPDEVDYRQGMSMVALMNETPQPRIPFFERYSSDFGFEELLP